jgi:hypothetical protein
MAILFVFVYAAEIISMCHPHIVIGSDCGLGTTILLIFAPQIARVTSLSHHTQQCLSM